MVLAWKASEKRKILNLTLGRDSLDLGERKGDRRAFQTRRTVRKLHRGEKEEQTNILKTVRTCSWQKLSCGEKQ